MTQKAASVAGRIERAQQLLRDQGLDAVIVSHPANRSYLSGFHTDDHGPDESSGVLLVDSSGAVFLTSIVNLPMAEALVAPEVSAADWGRPWTKAVGKRLQEAGYRNVGIEEDALTVASLQGFETGSDGAITFVHVGSHVDTLRASKDPGELATMREAMRITDEAMETVTAQLKPGMTELHIAALLDQSMRDLGADGPGFGTIVASGPYAARPHHEPSSREIVEGEPIIIDMGARVRGYNADLTRTVWVGEPTAQLRTIYTTVLAANRAAIAGIRAGMTGGEADALARTVIKDAGYGDRFTHSLGHGLGIKVHEAPSLREGNTDPLVVGQVVTIEPGIYLPEWGGVRIEDVVVIESDGARVLTNAPIWQV